MPDTLGLDFGIEKERGCTTDCGQAKIDRVAELLAAKPEFEADRCRTRMGPLSWMAPSMGAARPASGPAHSVGPNPPSRARAATAPLWEESAKSRKARYKLDLPVPLAPVTTLTPLSGITSRRIDR